MGVGERELATAIGIAQAATCVLEEADASREMGRLYTMNRRNEDALALLRRARRLFLDIGAAADVAEVDHLLAAISRPAAATPTEVSDPAAA